MIAPVPRTHRYTAMLFLLCVALLMPVAGVARAGSLAAVRFGLLDHATKLIDSGAEHGVDFNFELLFKPKYVPDFIPWSPYPVLGASFNFSPYNTDQIYAGLMWQWLFTKRSFIHLTGGFALHDGALHRDPNDGKRALGDRVLFRGSIEIGRRFGQHSSLAIVYDHISNGPMGGPNKGIDNLGMRYSYFFDGWQ